VKANHQRTRFRPFRRYELRRLHALIEFARIKNFLNAAHFVLLLDSGFSIENIHAEPFFSNLRRKKTDETAASS
jgi:hypothetical protein